MVLCIGFIVFVGVGGMVLFWANVPPLHAAMHGQSKESIKSKSSGVMAQIQQSDITM